MSPVQTRSLRALILPQGQCAAEKQRIIELLRAGEFAETAAALKQMMELRDASAEQYAAWAKEELKRLRAIPAEVRAVGPQIVETALDMMTSQQYAEAAGLLGAVPEEYRSKEAATLLEKATRLGAGGQGIEYQGGWRRA